jgi:5-hydroxyisourate hydrolase-like protein (transthyretin family)
MRQVSFNFKTLTFIALNLFGLAYTPQAFAIQEGPGVKNLCTSPQNFGSVALPFSIEGTLTPTLVPDAGFFDADFFEIVGTPGDTIAVEYTDTSQQTAVFIVRGSVCDTPIETDQDFGFSTGVRLRLKVPDDGVVILSTSLFNASPTVSYQMLVKHYVPFVGTISGQVINADTGRPPSVTNNITLAKCDGAECKIAATTNTDNQGRFSFAGPLGGSVPAEPGTFQIFVSGTKPGTPNSTETFSVSEKENKDIGVIRLQLTDPSAHIGSIGGRVVDAVSGAPLPGNAEPFAKVLLYACSSPTSCERVSIVDADSQGRFKFTDSNNGGADVPVFKLSPGTYSIKVLANQYGQVIESDANIFEVLKDENRDVGDVHVRSLPIRFSTMTPCIKPAKGGSCVYSVTLTNGLGTPFNGEAWSIVNANRMDSPQINITSFQTGSSERLTLKIGESRTVKFAFPLPTASVPNNVNICADAYVGTQPKAVWNTVGHANVFCMAKSDFGLSQKPAKEAFELSNHLIDK